LVDADLTIEFFFMNFRCLDKKNLITTPSFFLVGWMAVCISSLYFSQAKTNKNVSTSSYTFKKYNAPKNSINQFSSVK